MTEGRRAVMVRVGPKNQGICGVFRPKHPMTERRHAVMGSGVPKTHENDREFRAQVAHDRMTE